MRSFKKNPLSLLITSLLISGSPALAFAETYSFPDAVKAALSNNPEMDVSAARINQAQSAQKQADSSRLPQINLSITGSYSNNPLNAFGMKLQQRDATFGDFGIAEAFDPNTGMPLPTATSIAPNALNNPDAYGDINTRIEILIPVWNGGKIKSFQEQATEMVKAAQQGDQAVQQYLTFNVYQAYEAVHAARAYIKVAEQAKKTADEFVRTTKKLVEQGVVVRSEFLSAKVNQSAAEVALMQAQGQEQIALDSLRMLMNLDATAPLEVADRFDLTVVADSPNEAVNVAMQNNPVLEAKRRQAGASKFAIGAASADLKPSFNLMVRQDWNDKDLGFQASSYTIAGVVAWKITDFGVTRSAVDMATASAAEKQAAVRSEENKVRLEVLTAWRKYDIARKQVESNLLAVQQADEAQSLISKRYENGVATLTEVLASQTRLDKARADLVSAQYEVNLQKAKIRLNVGSMDINKI